LKRFKDMKKLMKQMGKMGMGAKLGSKAKKQALKGMSPTGDMAGDGGEAGGLGSMLGGGGMGSLLGGGAGGMEAPPEGFNPSDGVRPMGSSSTRKRPPKRKKKPKKSRKGRKR